MQNNTLRVLPRSQPLTDFSSNDYLGLARDEELYREAGRILSEKSLLHNGATGSRLLTGNHDLYEEVEKLLSRLHRAGAALMFNSGYDANIGFFSTVPDRNDVVFFDEYVHASIREGLTLGRAKSYKFRHNDMKHLEEVILHSLRSGTEPYGREIYVVTESVFSMDGDSPDLKALARLCRKHGYRLVVDEAHAVGIFGPGGTGRMQELGLEEGVFARIITFGKAMGCHGAAILGSPDLRDFLVNFCRSLIYTTGLPPHSIASILSAYRIMNTDRGREQLGKLEGNIHFFNRTVTSLKIRDQFIPGISAIHSCILGGNGYVKQISLKLKEHGFDVRPILSPTVPEGSERLRFCLHASNSTEEITGVLTLLKKELYESAV